LSKLGTLLVAFVGTLAGIGLIRGPVIKSQGPPVTHQPPVVAPSIPATPPSPRPAVTVQVPPHLGYADLVKQLKRWEAETPDLAQVGTYGKSTRGSDLCYVRVTNGVRANPTGRPKMLITACIHGDEPLATGTVMAFLGTMLGTHGTDPAVTDLLGTRDVYFVPVVSPDSYPNSRRVDGVDPNRDFPGPTDPAHQSVAPVKALADFMVAQRFKAVISGHTFGRTFLTPYGNTAARCPNEADYQRVVGQMCALSGYRTIHAWENYGRPIYGSELDYYYLHGAFAIVMEMGTHQRIPTAAEIKTELDKTYRAFLYFVQAAPLVTVKAN
jgi:hypothetical protein